VLEEEEMVSKAMRGKVSDRIRAFSNNQGSNGVMAAPKDNLSHQEQSIMDGSSPTATAMQMHKSDPRMSNRRRTQQQHQQHQRNGSYIAMAYSGGNHPQSIGESIQEENCNTNHGPLHEQISQGAHPNRVKIQRANSPYTRRKLQSSQQRHPSDEIDHDNGGDLRYYRITFKGVVALLSNLEDAAAALDIHSDDATTTTTTTTTTNTIAQEGNSGVTSKSGTYYVGYGEIVATSSPEIIIPMNHSSDNKMGDKVSETRFVRAIRVDSILTGGYAADAENTKTSGDGILGHDDGNISKSTDDHSNQWLYQKMNETFAGSTFENQNEYGYLLLSSNHHSSQHPTIIAKPLSTSISQSLHHSNNNNNNNPEHGPFLYRITSSSPVAVLSGPSLDAVGLGLGLLPGTVHEVSLRIAIPLQEDANDDTLVDDADAGEIQFLRLGQRRGWIADRRIDDVDQKLIVSYLVQDVTHGEDNGIGGGGGMLLNNSLLSGLVDDASYSMMSFEGGETTSSLNSSALNSTANSSFYSSVIASTVATPTTVQKQRRRNRRRPRDAMGGGMGGMMYRSSHPPNMVRENHQRVVGGSFEEAGSSITGGGNGTDVGGFGDGSMISSGDYNDSSSLLLHNQNQQQPTKKCYYLMRVIAPLGLKILDAPHFQVSNLIHSPSPNKINHRSRSPATSPSGISPFARTNAMIGTNMSSAPESSPTTSTGTRKKYRNSPPRVRFLARGQIFEASQRMEVTGDSSLYTNGQGLIKLADGSGWAIVPHYEDLMGQFKSFYNNNGDQAAFRMNEVAAVEEIGNAYCSIPVVKHHHHAHPNRLTPPPKHENASSEQGSLKDIVWLRISAPPNGIKVLLPPPHQQQQQQQQHAADKNDSHTTPPSKHHGDHHQAKMMNNPSTSHESEVASSSVVSSSFFDSVWSRVTPTKESKGSSNHSSSSIQGHHTDIAATKNSLKRRQQQQRPMLPVIPCGTVVPVERWDPSTSSKKSFARLFNGQGWIPRCLGETLYAYEVDTPDIRVGSFWFRVKSTSGLDVRHGPSSNAPIIKSDNNDDAVSFRFECGEFLRASEVVTVFYKVGVVGGTSTATTAECFAKLYRRHNHHLSESNDSGQTSSLLGRYSSLQSLISPGEWVQVHDGNNNGELFLEECSTPPRIERNRDGGFQYTVIRSSSAAGGLNIHCGPSLQANIVGQLIMCEGEEVLVSEKVTTTANNNDGEQQESAPSWLRLKSGRGWVSSVGKDGQAVMQQATNSGIPSHGKKGPSNSNNNNNAEHSHRMVRQILEKGSRAAY